MPIQTHEELSQQAQVTQSGPSPATGAALEAGRTADRQRMEDRAVNLSSRLQRLQRRRKSFAAIMRRSALASVLLTVAGFVSTIGFSFWTASSRAPTVMVAGQVFTWGLSALFLTFLVGMLVNGLWHFEEAAVRKQAYQEGLVLHE